MNIDLMMVIFYFVVIFLIGIYKSATQKKNATSYSLSGHQLRWPSIANVHYRDPYLSRPLYRHGAALHTPLILKPNSALHNTTNTRAKSWNSKTNDIVDSIFGKNR